MIDTPALATLHYLSRWILPSRTFYASEITIGVTWKLFAKKGKCLRMMRTFISRVQSLAVAVSENRLLLLLVCVVLLKGCGC